MGTCLTGYLEVRKNAEGWNHVMTVNFWKDYPLMIALKALHSYKEGVPDDTSVWVRNRGPLRAMTDTDMFCDRVYTVDAREFALLRSLGEGEDREYVTHQTAALQAAIEYMRLVGMTCRLVLMEG